MKLYNLINILIIFTACKNNNDHLKTESKDLISNELIIDNSNSQIMFDNFLKCGEYTYMDGYFTIPDNGCVYKSVSFNTVGNAEIYLVPKKQIILEKDIEKEENIVTKMSISKLKENFYIYILLIDKKYLVHNDKMDIPYFPNYPYNQLIYKWTNGSWKNIKTLSIKDENDVQYKKWKSNFLVNSDPIKEEKIEKIKGGYFIKTSVESIDSGNSTEISFYFEFEGSQAILSIGAKNSLDAYCEGNYDVIMSKNILKLQYIGEGTCTSGEENSFFVKKEKTNYYIKSKRFLNNDWQLLKEDK